MQQRFAACEAHGLMMRFGEQCVDAGGDVFDAQRVCHVFKAAAARFLLEILKIAHELLPNGLFAYHIDA